MYVMRAQERRRGESNMGAADIVESPSRASCAAAVEDLPADVYRGGVCGYNRPEHERQSMSPPRGPVFGTAALERLTEEMCTTPGPGEYTPVAGGDIGDVATAYGGDALRAQQVHTGSLPRDSRFKDIPVSPGPGDYAGSPGTSAAAAADHKSARASAAQKGAVFGTEALERLQYPQASPGPGAYNPDKGWSSTSASPKTQLGTMSRAKRQVSSPLEKGEASATPIGSPGARRTTSTPTFGTSPRFSGPQAYTHCEAVPGPGEYGRTHRSVYPAIAGSPRVNSPRRATTPSRGQASPYASQYRPTPHRSPARVQAVAGTPKTPTDARSPASTRTNPDAKHTPTAASPSTGGHAPGTMRLPRGSPVQPPRTVGSPATRNFSPAKPSTPPAQRLPGAPVPVVAADAAAPVRRPAPETPGQRAWRKFADQCAGMGLGEEDLRLLSLDTLKALISELEVVDIVDAARIEVYWRQLQLAQNDGGGELQRVSV